MITLDHIELCLRLGAGRLAWRTTHISIYDLVFKKLVRRNERGFGQHDRTAAFLATWDPDRQNMTGRMAGIITNVSNIDLPANFMTWWVTEGRHAYAAMQTKRINGDYRMWPDDWKKAVNTTRWGWSYGGDD